MARPGPVVALQPKDDPFYPYAGSTPLESIAPGTALATRSIPYHILGVPPALNTTQLLYRSTSQNGPPDCVMLREDNHGQICLRPLF